MVINTKDLKKIEVDEDGEVDLSLMNFDDVPIKELVSLKKKIYSLDLSNNNLEYLPDNFSMLSNLTKIDLSNNRLLQLPESFGDLVKLNWLDLYKNELKHLPPSFYKLKNLKWLDLKDNPLVPAISKIGGPCLDSKQCQTCAKSIVAFYTELHERIEQIKQQEEEHKEKILIQKKKENKQRLKKHKKIEKQKFENTTVPNTKTEENIVPSNQTNGKSYQGASSAIFNFFIVSFWIFTFVLFASVIIFLGSSLKLDFCCWFKDLMLSVWSRAKHYFPLFVKNHVTLLENYLHEFHLNVGAILLKTYERFTNNYTVNK